MPSLGIKAIVAALAALAIAGLIFAGYKYAEHSHDKAIADAHAAGAAEGAAKVADAVQQSTIAAMSDALADQARRTAAIEAGVADLARQEAANRDEITGRLSAVLAKHNLEALAHAKPALLENRINAGTARALRLLGAAGAPPQGGGAAGPAPQAGQAPAAAPGPAPDHRGGADVDRPAGPRPGDIY